MSGERKIIIYPWNVSVTKMWGPDTGLFRLRDDSPEKLAELTWPAGIDVQKSAVIEMLKHGSIRKAAQFVRALVDQHPELTDTIRGQYQGMEALFDTRLEDFPESPADMDRKRITFVN